MRREDRESMIDRYASGPDSLRDAFHEATTEMLKWNPAEDEWSIHEIILHCADSEAYAGIRIRLLAAEPTPVIIGYDQERWARAFRYHDRPIEPAFAVIDSVRASTADLIASFGDAEWSAAGTHTETGAYTAGEWLQTYSRHLHDHADQIRSNIKRWHGGERPNVSAN